MTKKDYVHLRNTLDFKLSHKWLVGHIAVDLALLAVPVLLLFGRPGNLGFNLPDIGRCLVAALSLATLYFRSFSMMHEAVHGLIASHRRWNDFAGLAYGAICFLPFAQWREIHLLHHYWSGNIEKDPVRKITVLFRQEPTFACRVMSAFWPTWIPAAALMQNYVFWAESLLRFRQKKSVLSLFGLALPLVLWGSLFASIGLQLSAFVVIPSIALYLALVEMVNFPHHTDLPQYEGETRLALWEQYKTARSCFYPKAVERFVLLNFNYHIEHHLFPTLPWYRLESLSRILREQIPDYFFSQGNEWIRHNRKRSLKEVCLSQSAGEKEKAA